MITVTLKTGHVIQLSDEDSDLASVYIRARLRRKYLHVECRHAKRMTTLARVVMERVIGRPLTRKETVDHENGDTTDNRRCNLRVCTAAENNRNVIRQVLSKSGVTGVFESSGGWGARIRFERHDYYLGTYKTKEEAAAAHDGAALALHKEFAFKNRVLKTGR